MLSAVMSVTATGVLVYQGHKGQLYEIVGGSNGQLNLKEVE
jgi:hypothetical protein